MSDLICNHIIGYEDGVDESWVVYAEVGWTRAPYAPIGDIIFKFCPLCGVKLDPTKKPATE